MLAAAEARLVLGLADVHRHAQLLAHVGAGVHGDHRDARCDRVPDGIAERLGIGDRHHQAIGLRGHGGVDDLRHLHHVEGIRRAILDRDAEILGGLVDAVLDHRPERIGGLAVAHHHESHVLRCSGAGNSQSGGDEDSFAKHGFHACTPCVVYLQPKG